MDTIRGIRYEAEGTSVEVIAWVHDPVQRPETGHWVCRYELVGIEDRSTNWTGNFAETARSMSLGILRSTLFRAGVAVDGASLAILTQGHQETDPLPDNPPLLQARARIHGERRRPDGVDEPVTAEIGPPFRVDEHCFECPLHIPAIRRKPFRLFGVDASQALEACLFLMESEFEQFGVRWVDHSQGT